MSRKNDFGHATKELIGQAVAWHCSVPLCKNPALAVDDGKTINGGTACHIYSASKNGPRGTGGLSDAELTSADNGLWCCAFHGRVIDANQGSSFPAAQLQMWKRLAEGRVRRAMAVEFAELGWVHNITVVVNTECGRRWEVSMNLNKNNLIGGSHGDGRSLLLEALASISGNRHAWRLRSFPAYKVSVNYETITREATAQVGYELGQSIWRMYGGKQASLAPPDMIVLYLNPTEILWRKKNATDFECLTKALGIDEDVLISLIELVNRNPDSGMSITIETDDSDEPEEKGRLKKHLSVLFHGKVHAFPFGNLAGSEEVRVALALQIALAREEVKTRPVLLCIDALWNLDGESIRRELLKLSEEHIQLIVVAPHAVSEGKSTDDFPGWCLVEFPSIKNALRQSDSA